MTDGGGRTGSPLLRLLRRCLPVLISAGLIGWVVVKTPRLLAAAAVLNWPALVPLTLAELLALYFWDSVCLTWLFSLPDAAVPFRSVLGVRARSYVWTVFNYQVGQGALAWGLARVRGLSFTAALGRIILLGLHDLAVLFSLGLAASFVNPEDRTRPLRWLCLVGLLVLAGLALTAGVVPGRWRVRLGQRVDWLAWWRPRHSLAVAGLRLAFFLIIVGYVTTALWAIGLPQGVRGVCGVIPLMLLAEALPSVSGLGARDMAVVGLLHPPEELTGVVLSFTLLWWSVLLTGRLALGLTTWWLAPPPVTRAPRDPAS